MTSPVDISEGAAELRQHPLVLAWIKAKQDSRFAPHLYPPSSDCHRCGFPHNDGLLCNTAPFGEVRIAGHLYSIALRDVKYMVGFVQGLQREGWFHWRNERFFRNSGDTIEVRFYEPYNGSPQEHLWKIPRNEWDTIVQQMSPLKDSGYTSPEQAELDRLRAALSEAEAKYAALETRHGEHLEAWRVNAGVREAANEKLRGLLREILNNSLCTGALRRGTWIERARNAVKEG